MARMGHEAPRSKYDELHRQAPIYQPGTGRSFYTPMYERVAAEVRKRRIKSVLEVGCGGGAVAELILKDSDAAYRGFDFSSVGVQNARARTARLQGHNGSSASYSVDGGAHDRFFVGDALDPESYASDYDGIVCTEVLEHIVRDLDVVAMWRPGTQCICSVPNFDYDTHVRHFRREEEVRERYGSLIDIDLIARVPRPLFTGKTFRQYLNQLRWARVEPKKFLGLLGINQFEWYYGWFVFAGRRVKPSPAKGH